MDTVVVSIRVPADLAEKLDAVRLPQRMSRQELLYPSVIAAIQKVVERKEEEAPSPVAA